MVEVTFQNNIVTFLSKITGTSENAKLLCSDWVLLLSVEIRPVILLYQ